MITEKAIEKINKVSDSLEKSNRIKFNTTNGVKEFNCKRNGYIDNIYLEGKTLVNIVDQLYRKSDGISVVGDNVVRTRFSPLDDKYITNQRLATGTWTFYNMTDKPVVFVGVNKNDTYVSSPVGLVPAYSYKTVTFDGSVAITGVDFQPAGGWDNSDLSKYNETMVMVVEGEHKEMPYFKGIKDVGGDNSNIGILNYKKGVNIAENLTFLDSNYISSETGNIESISNFKCSNEYIEVEPNKTYLLYNINLQVAIFDSSKNIIPIPWQHNKPYEMIKNSTNQSIFTLTMPYNAKYIKINLPIKNITPYFIYETECDYKQIHSNLNSIDNIKDIIFKNGNKYYRKKMYGKIIIDDKFASSWTIGVNSDNNIIRFTSASEILLPLNAKPPKNNSIEKAPCITDRFMVKPIDVLTLANYECIGYGTGLAVSIRIAKNRLESLDANGLISWLRDNPITMIYEFKEPVIEEINDFNPCTFNGDNVFLLNTDGIQTNINFEVVDGIVDELGLVKNKVSSLDSSINKIDILTDEINNNDRQKHKLCESNGTVLLLSGGSDLNNITDTGFYNGTLLKNAPLDSNIWFYVEVLQHTHKVNGYVYQRATTLALQDIKVYHRVRTNEWKPWVQVYPQISSLTEQQISELELQLMEREV